MTTWSRWLSSFGLALPPAPRRPAEDIGALQDAVLALLHDCDGAACERLRRRLRGARSANDLWLARAEVFDIVALQHSEGQAAQRVDALAPHFAGARR